MRNVRSGKEKTPGPDRITHRELVERGASWLRSHKHKVVCTETVTKCHEVPDVIGWKGVSSTLIECKVSRADFKKDQEKLSRIDANKRVGQARYYLTPPGLIQESELPSGWGLLELHGLSIREQVKSVRARSPLIAANELKIVLSLLRRAELRGVVLTETLSERLKAERAGRRSKKIVLGERLDENT